jgi:hypothetical protein
VWQALADSADANLQQQLGRALRVDGVLTAAYAQLGVPAASSEAWFAALAACGALRPEPVLDASLARRVGQIPAVGTAAWGTAVGAALRGAWDTDGSGALDRPDEVEGVGCDVWAALDVRAEAEGVEGPWAYTLSVARSPAFPGVAPTMRGAFDARLSVCGLGPRARAAVPADAPVTDAAVVDAMRAFKLPTLSAWEDEVRALWLEAFDRDDSLALERADEVLAIPCDAWRMVAARVASDTGAPWMRWYGLVEGAWEGERLGLRIPAQAAVARRLTQCRLLAGTGARDPEDRAFEAALEQSWSDALAALRAPGAFAKRPWTCARWTGLDRLAQRELGGLGLLGWLGGPGSWRGAEIGRPDEAAARGEIAACALSPNAAPVGAQATPSLGGIAARLAEAVRDTETPGMAAALRQMGCSLWVEADNATRAAWGAGVDATFALDTPSGATLVGVEPRDAKLLHRHLKRCGLHGDRPRSQPASQPR